MTACSKQHQPSTNFQRPRLEGLLDRLNLNGQQVSGQPLKRVSRFLEHVRKLAKIDLYAIVESENNFLTGAGLASSSSAFAALALAAAKAAGLELDETELSRLARLGSGSASRSVPAGFVEWHPGDAHDNSYAQSIAAPSHWNLTDCIAVVSQQHKSTGSSAGHRLADSSPIQTARVKDADSRLNICREALLTKDFSTFAQIVQLDCNLMHAVMMTSQPPLLYWQPATLAVIQAVQAWRADGIDVCYTIDAGPNVHVLCLDHSRDDIERRLNEIEGVLQVIVAQPGGPAKIV
ncbi:MAG: diphosphomevalonate decarboxylase [Chloroflexi bacterium]|nr:diphosphomevalonate decarboxylase [Chloroflexota bacterium]